MNLSPLAGFCTFILMIGQVLILPFLKFLNSWSDRSIDPPDSGIQPRISPTTEFHTVPADPSGQLSNRQCLARPFSTHPLPGGCAVFIAVCLHLRQFERTRRKQKHQPPNLTPRQRCSQACNLCRSVSQQPADLANGLFCYQRNCCFNGLDHHPSLRLGGRWSLTELNCVSGFMYSFHVPSLTVCTVALLCSHSVQLGVACRWSWRGSGLWNVALVGKG